MFIPSRMRSATYIRKQQNMHNHFVQDIGRDEFKRPGYLTLTLLILWISKKWVTGVLSHFVIFPISFFFFVIT